MSRIVYEVSERRQRPRSDGALVDRGANGCVFGDDVRPFACPIHRPKVDVSGFDGHQQNGMIIVSAGGVVETQEGPTIVIINQGALYGKGKTILSPVQMEAFGVAVSDKGPRSHRS